MQLQIKASGHGLAEEVARGLPLPLALRLHDRMEPLEATWRDLERENGLSLHQSYDWCRAWVETHGCPLLVVEGLCDDHTQFILPFEIVRHGTPITARFIAKAIGERMGKAEVTQLRGGKVA